jgi:hypothetical protein
MLSRRPVLLLALGLGSLALADTALAASARFTAEGAPLVPVRASAPMTVMLRPPFDMRGALRKLPTSLDEGPVVRLSIERVKAPAGASIRVFINYPAANADTPTSDFHYVGSLNVFEAPPPDSPGDDFLLDAGRALKRLKKGDRLLPGEYVSVTLVLVPDSAGADATIPVERVVLAIEETPGQ